MRGIKGASARAAGRRIGDPTRWIKRPLNGKLVGLASNSICRFSKPATDWIVLIKNYRAKGDAYAGRIRISQQLPNYARFISLSSAQVLH